MTPEKGEVEKANSIVNIFMDMGHTVSKPMRDFLANYLASDRAEAEKRFQVARAVAISYGVSLGHHVTFQNSDAIKAEVDAEIDRRLKEQK